MLPLVGSTITELPRLDQPVASSAASIIATPIRSLTEPPGIEVLELDADLAPQPVADPLEPHHRRVTDDRGRFRPDPHLWRAARTQTRNALFRSDEESITPPATARTANRF